MQSTPCSRLEREKFKAGRQAGIYIYMCVCSRTQYLMRIYAREALGGSALCCDDKGYSARPIHAKRAGVLKGREGMFKFENR